MVHEPLEQRVAHDGDQGDNGRSRTANETALQNFFYTHFKDGCAMGEAAYLLGVPEANVIGYLTERFGTHFKGQLAEGVYVRADEMVSMAGQFSTPAATIQERYENRWRNDAETVNHRRAVEVITRMLARDMVPPPPSPTQHETYLSPN